MKITIIGPAYPYRGGIALFSNRLAEALMDAGHEVKIVTFKMQYPSFLFPGKTQFSSGALTQKLNIVRSINSINPFNWIKVGKQLKKDEADLVIFKYWMPFMAPCFGFIAKQLRSTKKTKILALLHNLVPHEKRIGDEKLTRFFLKRMDGCVVMSKSVMADLIRVDPEKPHVFSPHPLYDNFGVSISRSTALKALNLDPKFNYLLFFGIIRKYKGLDLLLEAFGDSRLNNGSIKLIVAGEFYEDDAPYMGIIEKHGLKDNVILNGSFIPDEEVVNYFCGVDMVVQPYRNATQSGVTQIAYHFNKPMLVTDVGGLNEIVPHNKVGYVVKPKAEAVADALVDFYANSRAAEFIVGVEDEKKKYAWEKMVGTIEMLYKDV